MFILEDSIKFGIVTSWNVGYSFYYRLLLSIWAGILKPQSFIFYQFLTLSVRDGPSVSFGTNVPWSIIYIIYLPFPLVEHPRHYS